MGVGFVSMLGYEFSVNADVEFAVTAGDEGEGADAVADAVEGVAGHPGGAEGVASIVAVFDFDGVFFRVGHGGGSFGGGFVFRNPTAGAAEAGGAGVEEEVLDSAV